MLRPLGRITPAPVLRYDDKTPQQVRMLTRDISDWLAEGKPDGAAEVFATASAGVLPVEAGGIVLTSPQVSSGVLRMLASGGNVGIDYQVTWTWSGTSGRTGQETWRILCVPAIGDVTTAPISGDDLLTINIDDLPTAPDGLPRGTIWLNGNIIMAAT